MMGLGIHKLRIYFVILAVGALSAILSLGQQPC